MLMQKIKSFCVRHRLWLCLLGVALAAALVLAWAGYDLAERVNDRPVFDIVNDDYSRTVEIPDGEGLHQAISLRAGQRVYGVRVDMATFNRVFTTGTFHADLCGADGAVITTSYIDMLGLKDNTFVELIFDDPYTAPADGAYTLRFWIATTAAEPLGLWASGAQVDEMALTGGGQNLDATVALQFVTDYSGGWSNTLSLILGVLLFAAIVLGFVLLFIAKTKLWLVFAVEALLLGGAFSLVTPPLVAPDEYTHLAASYRQASALLGQQTDTDRDGTLYLNTRACDAPYFKDETGDIGIFAYKQMLEGLSVTGQSGTCDTVTEIAVNTGNSFRLYWGQTAGIALARLLGLGFFGMTLLGRLGNLLLYVALGALAVGVAPPRLRGLFACIGLLPMATQLTGSLSGDGIVLGLVFGYTALCMALREHKARPWELCLLLLFAMGIGPLKAIYLPVVLLCLLIPSAHLDPRAESAPIPIGRKHKLDAGTLLKAAALALASLFWLGTNMSALRYATRDVDTVGISRALAALLIAAVLLGVLYALARRTAKGKKIFRGVTAAAIVVAVPVAFYKLTHMWGGLGPEELVNGIQANGDSIYTYSVGYICRNIPGTVKLLLRSVSEQAALWLQGLLGTALGEPIVYSVMVSWVLGVGLVLLLLAAALPRMGDTPLLGRRGRWGMGFVLLAVLALSVMAALSWTPINYRTIFGLQGRSWLPVLPLALLLIGTTPLFRVQKDIRRPALFAAVGVNTLVLLQGYGIYAAFEI